MRQRMRQKKQLKGQTLIDIALQEYGAIEGLELLYLNNSDVNLHTREMSLNIEDKVINSKAGDIQRYFKTTGVEVKGCTEKSLKSQFSNQFSNQFN